jgi:hypothetical protein
MPKGTSGLTTVLNALKWRQFYELHEETRTSLRTVVHAAMVEKLGLVIMTCNVGMEQKAEPWSLYVGME